MKSNYHLWTREFAAYFTGYFLADGHLVENKNTIVVKSIDVCVLDMMQQFTGGVVDKHPSDLTKHQQQWYLQFTDYYFCQQMRNCGVTSNKSCDGIPWLNFGEDQRHFIRGFTDGDGGITRYTENERGR